ncbi:MAG: hypothetical protein F6K58_01660 [Symploca sp. SIO2E9]|nr:hypothetical protein [Symploca sp. SIO2E9]
MRFKKLAIKNASTLLLLVFIVIEISITLIYLQGLFSTGKAYPWFDMNGLRTIPSLLQSLQLFLIGFISLSLLIVGRRSSLPPSQLFLLVIALLFIYASVDELFKIHLQLHKLSESVGNRDWMPVYLAVGVATLTFFYRDFIALWYFQRRAILFVALGMGIFVFGGFGAEVLKDILFQPLISQRFEQGELVPFLLEKMRVAFEEFSEMLGQSFTLYGIYLFVVKRFEKEPMTAMITEQEKCR